MVSADIWRMVWREYMVKVPKGRKLHYAPLTLTLSLTLLLTLTLSLTLTQSLTLTLTVTTS